VQPGAGRVLPVVALQGMRVERGDGYEQFAKIFTFAEIYTLAEISTFAKKKDQ
jgi:hypothetical protein